MIASYPLAPRADLVEELHGVPVADPFRRLENGDDPETVAWVAAQNALTRRLIDGPDRERLVERLRDLHRHARSSAPSVRGRRVFFTHNDGTRNQAVLTVMTAEGARSGEAGMRTIVDPGIVDSDGTTAITGFEPDGRGERVVYALSRRGSDAQELRVHDVEAGRDLADRLEGVKFASVAWAGPGFFYTRYPRPGTVAPEHEQYFCQVWFHRLGDPQSSDRLVYGRPDAPEVVFDVNMTADGRCLVITSRLGASDKAEVHVVAAASLSLEPGVGPAPKLRALVTGFTDSWRFIDGEENRLYFVTDAGAPMGRIVRLDVGASEPLLVVVVPESTARIETAVIAAGRLLVVSLRDASSRIRRCDLSGHGGHEIDLPGPGTVAGVSGRWHDDLCCLTFTSYTLPPRVFACDVHAGTISPLDGSPLPIDPSSYVTEQVRYPSKDGTPVSMFLVRRTDAGPSGGAFHQAVLLTGYGGFDISLTPAFDPSDFLWLDRGGTLAVANLRGGGEYGEAWHRAGMLDRKQNVFDDFVAAAEWLLAAGRAAPGAIAIEGGSNGGLLVAAAMVQRPDLFGAVICRVPVADMLRYHLFTVGRFWIPEYGSADDPGQFPFLHRYSPYHNVVDGVAYPPTLVMTADTDDRVAPGLAKKFAARLQEAVAPLAGPILLRVETRAGHGAGKPVSKQVDEQADIYAFLLRYLTRAPTSEQER